MKHVKITILILIMVLVFSTTAAAAGPKVYLDGRALHFDVDPVIENNRSLVPLRDIFEAMGAKVEWDQQNQTACAVKGNTTVKLTVGNTRPMVNGKVQALDTAAKIVNQRILAPLRFVGEAFGGTVSWEQTANRIDIITQSSAQAAPSQNILKITGEKLKTAANYSLSDLQGMQDITISDTYYSRGKAKENWAAASHNEFTGISLAALIEDKVGFKTEPARVKIKAEDGYTLMLSWKEVKASYLDETKPDKQLTTILAWSQDGQPYTAATGSCLRLIIGQKYQGDFNRQSWVHSVNSIAVE